MAAFCRVSRAMSVLPVPLRLRIGDEMSTRTTGVIAIGIAAILGVGRAAVAQDGTIAESHERGYHIFLAGKAHMTVHDALQGAIRRLALPACRDIVGDFSDEEGRPLTMNIATAGRTLGDFLADLYFVDGDDTPQCRGNDVVAAFTAPGSRVIHVCGERFTHFAANTKRGEILLIHELLHALGVGENPPSSSYITQAVMNHCG